MVSRLEIVIDRAFGLSNGRYCRSCSYGDTRFVNASINEVDVVQDQDNTLTRMWANVQRDGRPAEYRWRPLFNAAKFG